MTDRTKILDLVRKLLAKADSAQQIGSMEEAATFAAKASELLMRHKLELSEVELQLEEDEDPLTNDYADISESLGLSSNKREPWLTALFHNVAKAHFCTALYVPHSKRVRLIGRESNRQIVVYLVAVLAKAARDLAAQHATEARREAERTTSWTHSNWSRRDTIRTKASFLVGFVTTVRERLAAMRKEVEEAGGQFAMVRFNKAEEEVRNAAAAHAGKGRNKLSVHNENAYKAGQAAGQNVSLHGGLNGGGSSRGTLSRGQRLLGR